MSCDQNKARYYKLSCMIVISFVHEFVISCK